MESISANRYRLKAPVVSRWLRPDGTVASSRGLTGEISASGVFVHSTVCPPAGAKVQLEIALTEWEDEYPGVRLYGEGMVFGREPNGFTALVHFCLEAHEGPVSLRQRYLDTSDSSDDQP